MRYVLVITAFGGLWVMPALCESGILTVCCEQRCPQSDDTDGDCECSNCVDLCNAVVTRPPRAVTLAFAEFKTLPVTLPATSVMSLADWQLAKSKSSCAPPPRIKLPYAASDRPLLL